MSVALLAGLFAATAVLTRAGRSPRTDPPPSTLPAVERTGPGESTIWLVHPAWGLVKVVTHRNSEDGRDPGPASLTVRDPSGAVRFSWENEHMYWFAPAGTRPSRSGEDDVRLPVDALGTLPPTPDDYAGRFYCGGSTDLDGDGIYEIVKPKFCECTAVCEPDAKGHTYRWRGTDYVEQ